MKAAKTKGGILSGARRVLLAAAVAGAFVLGGSGAAHAQSEEEPGDGYGGLIGAVDDALDGATCDGPLGPVLNQLVNCDPEDEPPFQSYENGEF